MFKRIFLIVIDGLGIGESKDAGLYNNEGANTLKHVLETKSYHLPIFEHTGLISLVDENVSQKVGYACVLEPLNKAKDTLNGHYEMMGNVLEKPFKTYPHGFPILLISELQRTLKREIIGNVAASGTEIIKELGEMHMKTGALIVYTSDDSVLQVAAHEDIVPVEELYDICEKISKIVFDEPYNIGRVIARPFIGENGNFTRTPRRKDFTKEPPRNYMELLYENGYDVIALGKIKDIFANKNITTALKTNDNIDGLLKLVDFQRSDFNGLLFLNLNDTDTLFGHRRDREGYLKCLEEIDKYLSPFINNLKDDDLLMITGDHGNDPTFIGSDHTRENVPLVIYSKSFKYRGRIQNKKSLSCIGATIVDNFNINNDLKMGESLLNILK